MFTTNLSTLSVKTKRSLINELRASIKNDLVRNKMVKVAFKENKENERKAKVIAAIKAAEEKLAKLNAKLAV
jgi:RNA-binding protein YhbY